MEKTNLTKFLSQIRIESSYPNKSDWAEQNLYETYAVISELIDADNAYQYESSGRGIWKYKDIVDNEYYVRLAYVPDLKSEDKGYIELKTYWIDDSGKPKYTDFNGKSTNKDLQKRSDTLAKIYRDEVIPFFESQNKTKEMRIVPVDKTRYRLSKMLVSKYTPKHYSLFYFDSYISIKK